ncbi:Xanthine/uracil permease family protein [Prunus dulcis]|uniref:Xanthine/uracil permease family protein n=1 Tax=Prunus dulcis TaxID=3755 RepID=A0A4Y1S0T2_PRUDU|nr:Xanthine/uracil permease family protein [Prunus dulcis]
MAVSHALSRYLERNRLTDLAVLSIAYGHTRSICRVHLSRLFSGAHGLWIPNPFQWGSPTLDVGDAVTMMMAVLVATFEQNHHSFTT